MLVGRFIGFVRPIAPFIAGSSRMRYRRFLPYSVVGTGIWGPGLCVIGYVSYRSFSKVSKIAGQATLIFGLTVGVIVGIVYARKRLSDEAERERLVRWIERQAERPLLRPFAALLRPLWRRALGPAWNFAMPRLRFLGRRLTPGDLGIEFTSVVAVAGVGVYAFVAYAVTLSSHPGPTRSDRALMDLAGDTRVNGVVDVVKVFTELGTLPVVLVFMLISVVMLAVRRRPAELAALLFGFLLLILAVHLGEVGSRPRTAVGLARPHPRRLVPERPLRLLHGLRGDGGDRRARAARPRQSSGAGAHVDAGLRGRRDVAHLPTRPLLVGRGGRLGTRPRHLRPLRHGGTCRRPLAQHLAGRTCLASPPQPGR